MRNSQVTRTPLDIQVLLYKERKITMSQILEVSILMLVKHFVIIVMLGLGFWFNAVLRAGPQIGPMNGAAQALKRFRLYFNLMAISGSLVLLLTAVAQSLG
jgi:hypothetical protein